MSEETGTTSPAAADARVQNIPFDPSLENLVMLINLMETAEIGVTLHVGGCVVSGLLISGRRFFKILIHDLESSIEANRHAAKTVQGFADFFRPALEDFEKAREQYKTNDLVPDRPNHVHLRHVVTFAGSELVNQRLWRGRLTKIDGWSIGNYGGPVPELPQNLW